MLNRTAARFAPLLIPAALSVAFLAVWAAGSFESDSYDFAVFLEAGSGLVNGNPDIYSAAAGGPGRAVYLYPPTFAALFAPLSFLSRDAAYVLWVLISIWLWFGGLWALGRSLNAGNQLKWLSLLLLATCAPVLEDVRAGQVNLALTGVLGFMLAAVCTSRPRGTGALLAFAAHIKAIPGALVLTLVSPGKRPAVLWFGSFSLALTFLPAIWLLPNLGLGGAISRTFTLHIDYVSQLVLPALTSQAAPIALSDSMLNMSLPHALGVWANAIGMQASAGRLLGLLIGLAMLGDAVRVAWQRRESPRGWTTAAGLMFAAIVLMNVTTWLNHLSGLALALGAPLSAAQGNRPLARLLAGGCVALGLLCYLPQLAVLNPSAPDWVHSAQELSIGTVGVVVFWLTVRLSLRAHEIEPPIGSSEQAADRLTSVHSPAESGLDSSREPGTGLQ